MVCYHTLGSGLLFLCEAVQYCALSFIRVVLKSLSKFSLLISHSGSHLSLEEWAFASVEGNGRCWQQQVFGSGITYLAGRIWILWNLNNLGSHLFCLTVTFSYFVAGSRFSSLLLNILILISASLIWNLSVSLGIISCFQICKVTF